MSRTSVLLALSALACVSLAPEIAHACGGTFCDNLPDPMPVDQTGEDVLFVLDGDQVEAHVRIQYSGEAERFAWMIPLQAVPEISIGSDLLFTAMSQATAPRWITAHQYECDDDDPSWGDDGGGFAPMLDAGSTGEPEVVLEQTIGAYDVVVLEGGTAQEVINFLDANDYAQDPDAEPILQDYLDEGFLFAAVRLTAGAEVEEIHPLKFRFAGDEPCVPLRLTAIAADEDMGVRTYFLGQERWAPQSYAHVVLNPVAYDWNTNAPGSYLEVLSLAVDEAGGRAFATEYAGPSDVLNAGAVYSAQWDETAFVGVDPIAAIDLIADQGLNQHPLIRSLLAIYIPVPDGLDPADFWNNLDLYADMIDMDAWDDQAFAADVAERIIEPGVHAADLIEAWPYLTRLNTTISPAEMIADPTFMAAPDLPTTHSNLHSTAAQVLCGGDTVYTIDLEADGESASVEVCRPETEAYPELADMPRALRVEQIPMVGPPQVSADNTDAILAAVEAQQATATCMSAGGETGGEGDGGSSSDDGDGMADGGTGTPEYDLPYDTTCGCSSEGRNQAPLGAALGLLVLTAIAPWRRRRRR